MANDDKYLRLKTAFADLERRHAELQDSYYLSGSRKKIDLATLPGFSDIAASVHADGRAGMHYDRLYTLWQAAQRASGDTPIVEVGTYRGGSARFIAESFRARGLAPCFYVCDTFAGHPQTEEWDPPHHREGKKFRNTSADDVAGYLAPYSNVQMIVGDIIETAPARLAGEREFGLVHIDVDVYPPTEFCLRFFAPRLARGALLVVDDYGFTTCPGAKKAVDDFIAATPDFTMLHLLSGQAIVYRVS